MGWLVFLVATIVYFMTIEDTVSLWDCGEYITAAYKLEVGHPPGAPFFMVLGRLFSFFADPENVAVWINRLSALSSSLTILFMFWSITILVKKMILKTRETLSKGDQIAIFGSAVIGSLAYTFSESFWFSAVEGEVYAMASLFTAVIFWAILKWDEEMTQVQQGRLQVKGTSPDRWLLLIMFLLGLAIGVHLLGILVVPAITFMIYFRFSKQVSIKGILGVGVLGIVILGFIQEGVIPGSISLASSFEVAFVNSFGLPFYSGTIFFFALLVGACIWLLRYTRKKGRRILYSATMGLILLLIGYGSFAVIVIRSNANTPLDENDPENLVTLHAYLKREQYGSAPLMFGQYWNSKTNSPQDYKDQSPFYLRRFVVSKGGNDIKAYKDEARANEYAKKHPGAEVTEKYYESNASIRNNAIPTYEQTTFFPRMYWSNDPTKVNGYKNWSGYDPTEDKGTEKGTDGQRLPTFGENMTYFMNYQVNWMYWRYFMWNFAGRQNDIQGHGDAMRGNWISGISSIDNARLGDQYDNAPYFTKDNPSHNTFFFLPLILGVIGLLFHFYRAPKDAFVVMLAFLFTGLAIVVYLNQKPFEPRERDYAYAGSFYFFALWIGLGVYALYEAFKSFGKKEYMKIGIVGGATTFVFLILNAGGAMAFTSTMGWLVIFLIGAIAIGIMTGLGKVLKSDSQGAIVATLLAFSVPMVMGIQGWDDHDRSLKTSAHDLAMNYLNSCGKNGILFTNGDNDTFPLWYMQEVEGKRTDVRVCNLSLMQTDWYTEQMKMKAYDSEPLPIKFTEEQILMYAGSTDQVLFSDLFQLFYGNSGIDAQAGLKIDQKSLKEIIRMRVEANTNIVRNEIKSNATKVAASLAALKGTNAKSQGRLNAIKQAFSMVPADNASVDKLVADIFNRYRMTMELFSAVRGGQVTGDQKAIQGFQNVMLDFEKNWDYTDLSDAMAFVRNDDNLVRYQGQRSLRIFPSSGFTYPVNAENAFKSGIITEEQKSQCLNQLKFQFTGNGLTREQVMMLDVMANNNWERGLYFSSPGGSDVSLALYRAGYVKQNGMAFEVSPLNLPRDRYNTIEMYENLMNTYNYGEMSNPDVLTDYYTRRHTTQYRMHFLSLAEDFIAKALQAESEIERAEMMAQFGDQATSFTPSLTEKEIAEYKKKAAALLNKSLEVMPADVVIDWSEPTRSRSQADNYELNGVPLPAYNDGILHEYVGTLLMAGDKKSAEKLAKQVADNLETIFAYYEKSNVAVAARPDNTKDLYAALDGYFKLHSALSDDKYGLPDSDVTKQTAATIEHVYQNMFPSMMDRLKELANDNGESVRRGSNAGVYATYLFGLQDYSEAMGIHFGLIKPQVQARPEAQSAPAMPVQPSNMVPNP